MLAYVKEGTGKAEYRQIRGMEILSVPMPVGRAGALRRRRIWRKLYRMGIRRGIYPPAFQEEAARWGIRAVEVHPLRREVWMQLLPKTGTLAQIRAEHVDAAVEQAAEVLLRRFRYLRLETGWGTEGLAQKLLRRYGLGVGGEGQAEWTISFEGKPTERQEICLGPDCELWQQMIYENVEGVEDGELSEQLLCALFQSGKIKKEELQVKMVCNA